MNFAFRDGEHDLRNNLAANGFVPDANYVAGESEEEVRVCNQYNDTQCGVDISSEVDDQYNSWNLGISDVDFKSVNPHSDCFLQPAENSQAVDAGVDIGYKYTGEAPDLGAFETPGSGKSPACHGIDWPN